MILKFKKIIDLDKGIVEVDDQEIINVANKQLEEPKKDYEILQISFKRSDRPEIRNVSDYGQSYIESLLNPHTGNQIHSVKRLSDGEIFTIGDSVRILKSTNPCCEQGIIQDFSFWLYNINNLEKVKQPLFTTEDGVDVYQNSELWWVAVNEDTKTLPQDKRWEYDKFNWNEPGSPSSSKNYKWFSTKEKAEEYILLNKPCLSIFDITNNEAFYEFIDESRLKELVKSKL